MAATPGFPGTAACNECHEGTHQAQQRMVLGMLPDVATPHPSAKFMDGLTCASCHISPLRGDPAVPVTGAEQGCVGCHRSEFDQVLEWWKQGSRDRLRLVDASLERARTALAGSAVAAPRLDTAGVLLQTTREGGAVHNLQLSHQLLVEASDQVHQAYLDAGRSPPPPPELGREPRMGLCSYCHYRLNDPWLFEELSGAFHRQVLLRR